MDSPARRKSTVAPKSLLLLWVVLTLIALPGQVTAWPHLFRHSTEDKTAPHISGELQNGRHLGAGARICILSGDAFGAPGMGGTATAFWHLADALRKGLTPPPSITWLAVETPLQKADCTAVKLLYSRHEISLVCLKGSRSWASNPFQEAGQRALLWLRDQPKGTCQVLHSHEWGGILRPIIEAKALGEFPGLQINAVPHGGHMWSRGDDWTHVTALDKEIDEDERFVLENAGSVVSPSDYMLQYIQQRGWKINLSTTSVIGNPQTVELSQSALMKHGGEATKVVTFERTPSVAFFGRLEAGKGLHLFLQAIAALPQRNDPDFVVAFIGSDPSGELSDLVKTVAKAQSWRCRTTLSVGLNSGDALAQLRNLSADGGVLVVIPSLVENQPYAVAEIALAGLPMVGFAVGGVPEMLTPASQQATLVPPDALALLEKIEAVLTARKAAVPVLRPSLLRAAAAWVDWHRGVLPGNASASTNVSKYMRMADAGFSSSLSSEVDADTPQDQMKSSPRDRSSAPHLVAGRRLAENSVGSPTPGRRLSSISVGSPTPGRRLASVSVGSPTPGRRLASISVGSPTPGRRLASISVGSPTPGRRLASFSVESLVQAVTQRLDGAGGETGGVVLSGNRPGREYDCAEMPTVEGNQSSVCFTSAFQMFCCAAPAGCARLSVAVPTCSDE